MRDLTIDTRGVCKSFGNQLVLNDVTLAVEEDTVHSDGCTIGPPEDGWPGQSPPRSQRSVACWSPASEGQGVKGHSESKGHSDLRPGLPLHRPQKVREQLVDPVGPLLLHPVTAAGEDVTASQARQRLAVTGQGTGSPDGRAILLSTDE
jgi:hypothetical protein